MKKIFLAATVLSLAFSIQAQEIPERKAERQDRSDLRQKRMHRPGMEMRNLELTEAQREQFKQQRESFQKQMQELKKNDEITVKEWRNKMETLRKE
ncbi:MAG: hypothetical protein KDB99_12705, partial [Chitinophagaceae bacterium]|nr:hypothetical protein [Chitinophagaceae bacterium]